MGTMPINRLLITMSLPMIISMLVQAMYNIVDSIFVSRIDQAALTAVSMAFPIQNLLIAVSAGTCAVTLSGRKELQKRQSGCFQWPFPGPCKLPLFRSVRDLRLQTVL